MLRWLCLFALLANALLLLWYSSQVSESDTGGALEIKEADRLKLVSEINPKSLVWQDLEKIDRYPCVEFMGFRESVSAEAVIQLVMEQGFEAVLEPYTQVVELNYRLAVTLPQELSARLDALAYLEEHEGKELEEQALGFEYELLSFAGRSEAELKSAELNAVGISHRIKYDTRQQEGFLVRVFESIDRKLSSKIKEVVLESYSLEKNEKKVCERVASRKGTE